LKVETLFQDLHIMPQTFQTARLSTGGSAQRIQLGQPAATPQADLQMRPATPTLNPSKKSVLCEKLSEFVSIVTHCDHL
jgi:hypothetical protein